MQQHIPATKSSAKDLMLNYQLQIYEKNNSKTHLDHD